jgi:hypothetical protein
MTSEYTAGAETIISPLNEELSIDSNIVSSNFNNSHSSNFVNSNLSLEIPLNNSINFNSIIRIEMNQHQIEEKSDNTYSTCTETKRVNRSETITV